MSTQESKQLGKIVKTYRERLSLSQEQAAKMAGINRSVVAHLEQGLRLPKVKRIEALCKALEIPAEYWHAFTLPDSSERFASISRAFASLIIPWIIPITPWDPELFS